MFSTNQLSWLKLAGQILVGIFLWLAKSPLRQTSGSAPVKPALITAPQPSPSEKGKSMFNIAQILKFVTLAPVVIAGIEQLHGEADSATKKQLAQDSLQLAAGVADVVIPGQAPITDAVATSVSQIIDSVVSAFNATGVFSHKTVATTK